MGVLDAWEEGGVLFMAMELCEGGDLNEYTRGPPDQTLPHLHLQRHSSLLVKSTSGVQMVREEKLWYLCEQMARCVLHCHEHNIVHLDIKPSNFLVDSDR